MADVQIAVIDQQNTQLALAVPGVQGAKGDTGNVSAAGDGTAAAPGIAFASDTNTGIYRPGADQLAISTGGTGRLFIDANGGVGINTNTSTIQSIGKLVVQNGSTTAEERLVVAANAYLSGPTFTATYIQQGDTATTGTTFGLSKTNLGALVFQNTSAGLIGCNGGVPLVFGTSGLERMRLDSSGHFGVGVSTPSTRLHVSDGELTVSTGANSSLSGGIINFGIATAPSFSPMATVQGLLTNAVGTELQGGLGFFTRPLGVVGQSLQRRMTITEEGNVGIGIDSPWTLQALKFDKPGFGVAGNISTARQFSVGADNNYSVSLGYYQTGAAQPFGGVLQATDNGNGTILALNPLGGNVGIGTTSPSSILDARGTVTVKTADKFIQFNDGTNDVARLTYAGTGQFVIDANGPSTQSTQFWIGGTECARIDSSGRLLVGTSSANQVPTGEGVNRQPYLQVGSNTYEASALSSILYAPDAIGGGSLSLARSNTSTIGDQALANSGDVAGSVFFSASDGAKQVRCAQIVALVDGGPDIDDMPGRLVFSTTADGSPSPTPRMTIKSTGIVNVGNTPVYADNAAAKTGGLVDGDIYRTSTGDLKIVYT